jgi:Family of unknown function (DUF6235)
MSAHQIPAGSSRPSLFTVTSGLDLLDNWTAHATQAQKNTAYQVLFAVADHTAFTDYIVIDDAANHMDIHVLAGNDLTIKIRINSFDSFAILSIGPSTAPELDTAQAASANLVRQAK